MKPTRPNTRSALCRTESGGTGLPETKFERFRNLPGIRSQTQRQTYRTLTSPTTNTKRLRIQNDTLGPSTHQLQFRDVFRHLLRSALASGFALKSKALRALYSGFARNLPQRSAYGIALVQFPYKTYHSKLSYMSKCVFHLW